MRRAQEFKAASTKLSIQQLFADSSGIAVSSQINKFKAFASFTIDFGDMVNAYTSF